MSPSTIEGAFDGLVDGALLGWAWRPADPEAIVEVELLFDGVPQARVRADVFRGDLASAGKRGGRCAFSVPLAGASGEVRVRALGPGGPEEVPGGPIWIPAADEDPARSFRSSETGVCGRLDEIGPTAVSGWARRLAEPTRPVALELWADERPVLQFPADTWRNDLEERAQGDGRWGFRAALPASLRDGGSHLLDLRIADGGPSLLPQSILRTLPATAGEAPRDEPPRAPTAARAALRDRVRRRLGRPFLSVVVNFHDMRREAERTLTSLSRTHQRDVEGLAYEVVCVDNGSDPPLDAAWVESFGPEFRLFRPAAPNASPCAPINAAARTARGRHLAIMIDGAHLLSPGVLAEAAAVLRREPEALVALRQWFVGGDQRWLAEAGYTRAREDVLFGRIGWPADGYGVFRISAPVNEGPDPWFGGVSESNCLFVPARVWRAIGGYDERFDAPGGEFANLDLLRRAADDARGPVVCLIGEASFHQFHSGTTTNVPNAEKERRVQRYARRYAELRGRAFEAVEARDVRLAGAVRTKAMIGFRQRPTYPAPLGVTARVRPGDRAELFDDGAQTHLQSAYAELGLHETTRWLGEPVRLAPTDLVALQELIGETRPDRIVVTGADKGLLRFASSLRRLLSLEETRILAVAGEAPPWPLPEGVELVLADPHAPAAARQVAHALGTAERVLVLFDPPDRPGAPVAELSRWAGLVSHGSYIVYLRSALGQPWLGYSTRWPWTAIRALTEPGRPFAVDPRFDRHLVTSCPFGFIRRVGGLIELADLRPALDELDDL